MHELNEEIFDGFGLAVKNIFPYRDGFIVNTACGKKLLKKTALSEERLVFIHAAKEYLYNQGFTHIDRYLCCDSGKPYLEVNGDLYVATELIEGAECNFDNELHISAAAKTLAGLHKASIGFRAPSTEGAKDELGKIPAYFTKRLEEIKKLKKVAKRGKSKFDYMFLDYVDYFYETGEEALNLLKLSNYNSIVEKVRQDGSFCHHDYTHHNIICTGEELSVINFDYICYELGVYDLANLIRRKMRKCNWDVNQAGIIVREYNKTLPITDDEYAIMRYILQFPQKFWRVINRYYNSKRSWSERSYVIKLQEVLDEIEGHRQLLQAYETLR